MKNSVGKPLGYRSKPDLYDQIRDVLKQDAESHGDGMTANAIAKAIGTNDVIVSRYLNDMRERKEVKGKKVVNMTLYQLRKMRKDATADRGF